MTRDIKKYKNFTSFYSSLHIWIRRNWGKAQGCFFDNRHRSGRFEWANISGLYLRDKSDWLQLCPSCHRKFDYTEEQKGKVRKANLGLRKSSVGVKQLDKNGNLIKEWSAITDASLYTGIIRTAISNVLIGRAKTAGGYLWQYQEMN